MIYNYVDTYSFKRSQKYMSMSKAIWGGHIILVITNLAKDKLS